MPTLRLIGAAWLILLVSSILILPRRAQGEQWQYAASSDEAGFSRPLFRSITLSSNNLDIEEDVTYRGATQRYALLRYGTPNSLRVVVVVDEVSRADFDLYVDSDRDRIITAQEKVKGTGRVREIDLEAEVARSETDIENLTRHVIFRRGISANSLSFATSGFIEGDVLLEDKPVRARRVDGNGDGLFSAARDRVWLDLNGDGTWDGFSEQFPYLPILEVNSKRYALRGDVAGQRLQLKRLTGTGSVRLSMNMHHADAEVVAIDVMLVGADGSPVSLQSIKEAVVIPTGTYRVNTVRLIAKRSSRKVTWEFVFSDSDEQKGARAFAVKKGKQVSIDPIGKLRFQLDGVDDERQIALGEVLNVRPRLYTEDGLLINSCTSTLSAASFAGQRANIGLRHASGVEFVSTTSGFA